MYKCLIHLSKLHLQPKDITNHFYQNGFEFDVYTVVVYFSSDKIWLTPLLLLHDKSREC